MPRLVPGEGPPNARIMFVGEAPGEQEEKTGRPFVGPSGQLLTDLMHNVGILRSECYVTNVVKERPARNDIKPYLDLRKKYPTESPAYTAYTAQLSDEILRVKPNVIVAVGAVPLWTLCRLKGITNWRGSVLKSTLVDGVKVIPILHPAAALRTYIWRHFITFDLKKVKQHSTTPTIPLDRRTYILKPTYAVACDYLEMLRSKSMFGFDIEVSKGTMSCISFAPSPTEAICIPFSVDGTESYFTIEQECAILRQIDRLLADPNSTKIGQNVTFDSTFLNNRYGMRPRNLQDTMIAQAILYPEFPKSLGFITAQYTDMPYYKDEGKKVMKDQLKGIGLVGNSSIPGMSQQEAFWLYNAKDSIVLMEAFPKQVQELIARGLYPTYERQVAVIPPILYLTARGIKMDVAEMRLRYDEAGERLKVLEAELNKKAGREINARSPLQLKTYFYDEKGIKPYMSKGKETVDEKAMKRLMIHGYPEARLVLEIRKLSKYRGTYYGMKLDSDGRMRCSVNPVGTKFGRFSMSKTIFGTGANMQNQPADMKRLMLVDDGFVGFTVDLSQAENRVVAWLGPEQRQIAAFEVGQDIHALTASLIFQISYDEIKVMDKAGIKASIGNGDQTHRYWGKRSNHGMNYDLGPISLSLHLEIPVKDAKFLHGGYHGNYPGVRQFQARVRAQLQKNRTLENLLGRKCYFADRWGDKLFKEGYSFIPQSSVVDVVNARGLMILWNDMDLCAPVQILLQEHDSLKFQIPRSVGWPHIAEILLTLKRSLETPLDVYGRPLVIPADIKVHHGNYFDGTELKGISTTIEASTLAGLLEEAYHEQVCPSEK